MRKVRILALHGKCGNDKITKLQLQNLGITEDQYDITYIHGNLKEINGNPDCPEITDGPYYNWFDEDQTCSSLRTALFRAVANVLSAIQFIQPFDAIYAFSQGASVAALAALAIENQEIRDLLIQESNVAEDTLASLKSNSIRYLILACACGLSRVSQERIRLPDKTNKNIRSLHLIATEDLHKQDSEYISELFLDAQVHYITGKHRVSESIKDNASLLGLLQNDLLALQSKSYTEIPDLISISEISSISVMDDKQAVFVHLDGLMSDATITKALELQEPGKPLLYNARRSNASQVTTYGEVLGFINGGPGDLRHLGIESGDTVAYCAPQGAASVLVFLSIAAQTAAAPLAPTMSERDCLYYIDLYNAKHIVIFDEAICPGIKSASIKLHNEGKVKVHRASVYSHYKPGWFKYHDAVNVTSNVPLQNPSNAVALLLSTSGTTSKPKGVPISHQSIIHNGQILASSLGLRETDVCYNIMPLFHIGGISTSIISTLVSGGAICCDNESFNAQGMIEALSISKPQPTWYSAVPTIHNVTASYIKEHAGTLELAGFGIDFEGVWKKGHSLRFIRSGAAALFRPDAEALSKAYGNIPIIPTYSMSEQMPISQPPRGKDDMIFDKPGSVGVPVAASMAIVDNSTLKVLPYGQVGEVAIHGPTVMKEYLNNPEADKDAFFTLDFPISDEKEFAPNQFFLTGDTGMIDRDGFLTLKGRNKEIIKKGGEQVSPFEVEEILLLHNWIESALCFAVSSKVYGEEVGCALVLSCAAPANTKAEELVARMHELLSNNGLDRHKWPTKWKIVDDDDLPKTASKKYIRIGLSNILNMDDMVGSTGSISPRKVVEDNAYIDWDVISGFRFVLACYVMFMHIGTNESWSSFNNLRGFPWHVHCFFTLGGFSLAAPMNPIIERKFKYFLARIGNMYPMYLVALIFLICNLLVSCRPSTFRSRFHWNSQPDDLYIDGDKSNGYSPFFCEGTPLTPDSYWGSLILTITFYLFGLTVTPFWAAHWWMGYYLWFVSIYNQCLLIFPSMYNTFFRWRGNAPRFACVILSLLGINCTIILVSWFGVKDGEGYKQDDLATIEVLLKGEYDEEAYIHNAFILGLYLFSPFWMLYFVIGISTAFLYDANRPTNQKRPFIWGFIADGCTVIVLFWSFFIVTQGNLSSVEDELKYRPREANNTLLDTAATVRIWDNIHGRLWAPLTTLWIYSLSTGEGLTARLLRSKIFSKMSPHAYNCFLFHQIISQWYYAATRKGRWWNWWQYRKVMYWFSPKPVPVMWYEYFVLALLTIAFSALMQVTLEPLANTAMSRCQRFLCSELFSEVDKRNLGESVTATIEELTGIAPNLDWSLSQSGLSSIGLPQLARRLSTGPLPVRLSVKDLTRADSVEDVVNILKESLHKKDYLDSSGRSNSIEIPEDGDFCSLEIPHGANV